MTRNAINLNEGEVVKVVKGEKTTLWRKLEKTEPSFPRNQPNPMYKWCRVNVVGQFHHIEADKPNTVMHTVTPAYVLDKPIPAKECWAVRSVYDLSSPDQIPQHEDVHCRTLPWAIQSNTHCEIDKDCLGRFRPASHMPQWAVRCWVILSNPRVIRPADVTDDMARVLGFHATHYASTAEIFLERFKQTYGYNLEHDFWWAYDAIKATPAQLTLQ